MRGRGFVVGLVSSFVGGFICPSTLRHPDGPSTDPSLRSFALFPGASVAALDIASVGLPKQAHERIG
jgi:hypothetical protein